MEFIFNYSKVTQAGQWRRWARALPDLAKAWPWIPPVLIKFEYLGNFHIFHVSIFIYCNFRVHLALSLGLIYFIEVILFFEKKQCCKCFRGKEKEKDWERERESARGGEGLSLINSCYVLECIRQSLCLFHCFMLSYICIYVECGPDM